MEQLIEDDPKDKKFSGLCTPRHAGGNSLQLLGIVRLVTTLMAYFILTVVSTQIFGMKLEEGNASAIQVARWGILMAGALIGISILASVIAMLRTYRPTAKGKRFLVYLRDSGVKDAVVKVYTQLYLEPVKPDDPIQYMIDKLNDLRKQRDTENVEKDMDKMSLRIQELEKENSKLRGEVKVEMTRANNEIIPPLMIPTITRY